MDESISNRFLLIWILLHVPLVSSQNWKTGEWSTCGPCGEGQRRRAVWCSDSDGFKTVDRICSSRTKPIAKEDCFKVCHHLRPYLWWDIGDWSPCRPLVKPNDRVCEDTTGISKRNITCKYQAPIVKPTLISHQQKSPKIRRVPDSACIHFWEKPVSETACSFQCPRNCVVLKFEQTSSSTIETVISDERNGGKPCPPLHIPSTHCGRDNVTAACALRLRLLRHTNTTFETTPVLRVGEWGPCQGELEEDNRVSDGEPVKTTKDIYRQSAVIGRQTRSVQCRSSTGDILKEEKCLRGSSGLPSSSRRCLKRVDCQLSPWSEWRVVKEGCLDSSGRTHPEVKERRRNVLRFPQGKGKSCSLTTERRIIKGNLPQCRTKYKWLPLSWSACVVKQASTQSIKPCGAGEKTRQVICVHSKDLKPVSNDLCYEDKPVQLDECVVECDRDCVLSSWSAWSSCIPVNFKEKLLKAEEKYTKRTRRVISPATGNGACSEPLQQADECSQEPYEWRYGEWGECITDSGNEFGPGNRTRNHKCLLYDQSEISSVLCDIHSFLDNIEECYVPSSHDCVLSEWSSWSTCSMSCAPDLRTSGKKVRKRTVLAYNDRRSNFTCDNKDLEEDDFCNEGLCDAFVWKPAEWQKCVLPNDQICGRGYQRRDVFCFRNGIRTKTHRCSMLPELKKERACEVACPVDCKLTPFTDYSECPQNCDLGATKERERYVISAPLNGGKACPVILKESRPCYEANDPVCLAKDNADYSWVHGEWSHCLPLDIDKGCGQGLQTRAISCERKSGDGAPLEPWLCLRRRGNGIEDDSNFTFEASSPQLSLFRTCFVNCSTGCSETQWQEQAPSCLHTSCQGIVRKKELLGSFNSSSKIDCKNNEELRSVRQCSPPENLTVLSSNWSDCIAIHGECGQGFKYKRGHKLDETTCKQTGILKEACSIECPVDCKMSEWSSWSACTSVHSPGYKSRRRQVLQKPNASGRKCPNQVENELEEEEFVVSRLCDRYKWFADPFWSQCHVTAKSGKYNCGPGYQTRKIKCYLTVDDLPTEPVSSDLCNAVDSPIKRRSCDLPCPGDCVVSEWTEWTSCEQPCDESLNRTRSRKVLRQADSENTHSTQCPSLNETSSCILGHSCYNYEWVLGPWSSCVLPWRARCGFGNKERATLCRRQDGLEVDPVYCQYLARVDPKELLENCSIECVQDCRMSQWSQWSQDQCRPCNTNGSAHRTRRILVEPSIQGRPCQTLEQLKPCPYQACYHWSLGPWSECDLGINIAHVCGVGTRRRNVQCLRSDGVQVENLHCLLVNLSSEIKSQQWLDEDWLTLLNQAEDEEDCDVPCPLDCTLTPWSPWGDCHRECHSGETLGVRTRSRAVLTQPSKGGTNCSADLYQSLPCTSEECLSYEWFSFENEIKCRRSDGIFVTGGGWSGLSDPCVEACVSLGAQSDLLAGSCRCPEGSVFSHSDSPINSHGYLRDSNETNSSVFSKKHGHVLGACHLLKMGLDVSKNISDSPNIRFLPGDDEASFWMYAMISVGTAFVIFVIATVYLMCHSSIREKFLQVQRRRHLRRRSLEPNDPCSDTMLNYHCGTKTT